MATTTYTCIVGGAGRVYKTDGANWAATRGAIAGNGADAGIIANTNLAGTQYSAQRCFLPFTGGSIPATNPAQSGSLVVKMDGAVTNADSTYAVIVQSTQASSGTLVVGDFDAIGTVNGGSVALAAMGSSATVNIPLNSTGLGWASGTNNVLLAVMTGRDFDNNAPTGNSGFTWIGAGTVNEPQLVLVYPSETKLDLTSKIW